MKTGKEVDKVLEVATNIASKYGHSYISTEHMLLAILKNNQIAKLLLKFGVQLEEMSLDLESHIVNQYGKYSNSNPVKTQSLERVFNRSLTSVLFSGRDQVEIVDIFVSLMQENTSYSSYFLMKYNIQRDEFLNFVKKNDRNSAISKQQQQYLNGILNEFCEDLTKEATENKLDPVVGRDDIINDITQTFARRNKSNVLMVGDPGVGKTCLLYTSPSPRDRQKSRMPSSA